MTRNIQIQDIATLNRDTFKKNGFPYFIHYLDTGNLTKNKVNRYQYLDTKKEKIPSRAQRRVKRSTILYSTVRPNQKHYGFIEEKSDNLVVSTGFTTIDVIDEDIVPKFLYYLLIQNHITDYLHTIGMNSVSSYPSISPSDLGALKFKVPDYNQQKHIAKILSDLDAKIELNNKINAELEAMAKLIYDYWFVQFDFPDANGKPYKSSGGRMVYNQELKREIPEGWEVKKLKDFAKTGSGGTPLKSKIEYYKNGNIPWINSGEVNESFIVKADKFITEEGLNNSSAKMFNQGTILMAMYGATAGKVSLMDIKACTNQAICAINPNELFYNIYVKFGLEDLYKYLVNLSSGSARDNLSQDKINDLKFTFPEIELLKQFHEKVNSSMIQILVNMKENQKLTELRDWLLPMLMNGQVTVGEAEEKVQILTH